MKYFIMIGLFIFSSCVTNSYNTPFINAKETIELDFGMDRDEVRDSLNEPLFIAYGDNNEIIWVYEVRTIEVKSKVSSTGQETIPTKTSKNIKHSGVIHRLALTFVDGKLIKWEPYNE